jgi:hypothetical protein
LDTLQRRDQVVLCRTGSERGWSSREAPGDEKAFHNDGLTVAKTFAFPDQDAHDRAHFQDFSRHKGAFQILVYLLTHDGLSLQHAET